MTDATSAGHSKRKMNRYICPECEKTSVMEEKEVIAVAKLEDRARRKNHAWHPDAFARQFARVREIEYDRVRPAFQSQGNVR